MDEQANAPAKPRLFDVTKLFKSCHYAINVDKTIVVCLQQIAKFHIFNDPAEKIIH
jgi:hypothetical protein